MIIAEELRIGNRVFWKAGFAETNILVQVEITSLLPDKAGYIRPNLEHRAEPFEDDMKTKETPFAFYKEFEAIPITEEWLKKTEANLVFSPSINYVHELQNWYWENEKKELVIND